MSVWLEVRFFVSKCLLLLAHGIAALFRAQAHAKHPVTEPRMANQTVSTEVYALAPANEVFALEPGFSHHTLKQLPASEEYVWPMNVAKGLLKVGLEISLDTTAQWTSRSQLRRLFTPLPLPQSAKLHLSDETFARLRVQGPNPTWLRASESIEQLHQEGLSRNVDTTTWNAIPLYVVNYHALLQGIPTHDNQYLAPCIAIFTTDAQGSLRPLGIQLARADGTSWWQVPSAAPSWELAKLFFQSADMLVHEAVSHYLWTHVYGEKIVLATLRHLPESHPVRRLLAPHVHGTLRANYNSGRRLIGRGGLFDTCFGAGWHGTAELLRRGEALWRFDQMVLPKQLAGRGVLSNTVGAIADYPYRDDASALWNIVQLYVENYTHCFFPDEHLAPDPALTAWSLELQGHGFPAQPTRSSLNEVLAAALFNVVQHTFVNALQFDMFGCPLLFPATMRVPVPNDTDEVTEQTLIDALPTVSQTLEATRATYGFSIQYNTLGDDLVEFHAGPAQTAAATFVRELAELGERMEAADNRRDLAYAISHPRKISNSINA